MTTPDNDSEALTPDAEVAEATGAEATGTCTSVRRVFLLRLGGWLGWGVVGTTQSIQSGQTIQSIQPAQPPPTGSPPNAEITEINIRGNVDN